MVTIVTDSITQCFNWQQRDRLLILVIICFGFFLVFYSVSIYQMCWTSETRCPPQVLLAASTSFPHLKKRQMNVTMIVMAMHRWTTACGGWGRCSLQTIGVPHPQTSHSCSRCWSKPTTDAISWRVSNSNQLKKETPSDKWDPSSKFSKYGHGF